LLPHDQDTGGFYVCVIERAAAPSSGGDESKKRAVSPSAPGGPEDNGAPKKAKVEAEAQGAVASDVAFVEKPAVADAQPVAAVAAETKPAQAGKKKKGTEHIFKEDPFFYVQPDDPELVSCM
jgi:multisite-specific tRNA:(cytosine-C5)-methyltransferase